ncbi:MAG: MBL fold metallo-hydrolase [Lachnospiraceae bacterium]|nr:MBL fold metallo-hydrolase [Lachnospiraceae bacterium]
MKILRLIILLPALILLILSAGCGAFNNDNNDFYPLTVTFFDVGKGDCILIHQNNSNILIDAGYKKTADTIILKLNKLGIKNIDHMIITHYDKDHVGGAASIAETFNIEQLYLPDYEGESSKYDDLMEIINKKSIPYTIISEDTVIREAGMQLNIFASKIDYIPSDKDKEGNDNDVSLVTALYCNEDSYLFAGDIEEDGINAYLSEHDETYDILKIPHHGNYEDNSDDLINTAKPEIAIITDSDDKPADTSLTRLLEDSGIEVYLTSKDGSITVTGTENGEYITDTGTGLRPY